MNEIIKIDLDIGTKKKAIAHLKERLIFLSKINILQKKLIVKIELIKKNKYSAKIEITKCFKDKKDLIIIQSILGSDYKHTSIIFRDYHLGIKNFNRLFDIKRYPDGTYKIGKTINVTKEVLETEK